MKTGAGALGTKENESESAKHENRTRLPRYRRKQVRERKTRKRDTRPSVPPKISAGTQYKKTILDDLGTDENDSGSAK
jgi:hypothetical protein